MKTWRDPSPVNVPDTLRENVGGHRVVSESLVRRGVQTPAAAERFLDPDHYSPAAPDTLPDMAKAVSRLQEAINRREPILVWGDFDVDGQTSTALLVSALRDLGAEVRYHIPNRFSEGHGVHLPTLKKLLSQDNTAIILTCDTGIAAHEAVSYAQGRGIDVIITDHHSLPPTLPKAFAAVNPMRLADGHPLRELPGVGTAYKLVEALYDAQPGTQNSAYLLDLVAMGIVADVMVQVDDTRYLLQRGLERLRNTPRPGLRAMMTRAGITPAALSESDIGFSLAPRLNASGRLADANSMVELLTTDNAAIIAERVNELEGLNQKRKFLTRQVYEGAQRQIENKPDLLEYAALVLAGDDWHTGVVGIVASRLVDDYARPVLVLSRQGDVVKGSARSIAGCNIVQAIASQSKLLDGFGGHTMAAGLTMPAENLFAFRRGLSRNVRQMLHDTPEHPELTLDAYIKLHEIDLDFADDISRLAPFGNGNPPLTLATRNVKIVKHRTMGSRGDHLDLRIEDSDGQQQRVVWWFGEVDALPEGRFDIAYTVRSNVYKGKREALVEWLDARPINDSIQVDRAPLRELIDERNHPTPHELLQQFPDALIWSEGVTDINGRTRYDLAPADTLLLWTTPPGFSEWRALLGEVQARQIVVIGAYRAITQEKSLLQYVAGLLKYAFNRRGGEITVQDVSGATAHRERTARLALLFAARVAGLHLEQVSEDGYCVIPADKQPPDARLRRELLHLLKNTHAYHQLWHSSEHLLP